MEELRCSICGSILSVNDTFCPNCGSPVETPVPMEESNQEPVVESSSEPVMESVTEPVVESASEPVMDIETSPAAEPVVEAPVTPIEQGTTVLSGNPFSMDDTQQQQGASAYTQGAGAYNATYQDIPVDSTNYQGGYVQNAGVYTQSTDTPKKDTGKGLGIVTMIVGIVACLCCPAGCLFGLAAIILAIVCMAKKKGKPFSIIGLVTGILGFVIGIVVLVSIFEGSGMIGDVMDELGTDTTYGTTFGTASNTSPYIAYDLNQVIVDGDIYTLPGSLNTMGLSLNDNESDTLDDIMNYGIDPGSYQLVRLDSENGNTMWGYLENLGSSTVYSLEDLYVTGLNVDNYSDSCTVSSFVAWGDITLSMSRSEVEAEIGTPDDVSGDFDVYISDDSSTVLRIRYDSSDYAEELDVTYYN